MEKSPEKKNSSQMGPANDYHDGSFETNEDRDNNNMMFHPSTDNDRILMQGFNVDGAQALRESFRKSEQQDHVDELPVTDARFEDLPIEQAQVQNDSSIMRDQQPMMTDQQLDAEVTNNVQRLNFSREMSPTAQ